MLDSLGAISAARLMGVPLESIQASLAKFAGARRRFETKGRIDGIWVVDDYAHHPTEINATLKAARETGAKEVVCVFQPHRYTRTKLLHDEFCECFRYCDKLILTHIYSAGEAPIEGVTSKALAADIEKVTGQQVLYIDGFDEVENYLFKTAAAGDLIITMGAGDVFRIGEILLKELREVEK